MLAPVIHRALNCCEMFSECVECALRGRISRDEWRARLTRIPRHGVCGKRGNENDVCAFAKQWQKLLYKKERAADVCRKEAVEIIYRVIFNRTSFRYSGV